MHDNNTITFPYLTTRTHESSGSETNVISIQNISSSAKLENVAANLKVAELSGTVVHYPVLGGGGEKNSGLYAGWAK